MRKILKVIFAIIVFVSVVLIGAKALASATNNPIFPTRAEVQQWITEATGQAPIVPPITCIPASSGSSIGLYDEENYGIWADLECKIAEEEVSSGLEETWGIAHLPSGDKFATFDGISFITWIIPESEMPPVGTPINVDTYVFYAGKSIHINQDVTDWQ